MKKIVTIVGARPQFIKAAVLSRLIRSEEWENKFNEVLVHTGQHYDKNMSEIFFTEMEIPEPDYNLNIGSGNHGKMTGEMLIQIEEVLLIEKPDIVLVYGDTNSTLAGALAASKLNIPVAHVESGLRSFWKSMPEEQNRILTDHLAKWLFAPTQTALNNLYQEGIRENTFNVGDIMLDANIYYRKKITDSNSEKLEKILVNDVQIIKQDFVLATIHRAENTDDINALSNIFDAFNCMETNIIIPLHPRTKAVIRNHGFQLKNNIHIIEPVSFFEMMILEERCSCIITDSGGVQKEAYFMHKPCITLRNQTEWIETVESGWNIIVGTNKKNIIDAFKNFKIPLSHPDLYGKGSAGEDILKELYLHKYAEQAK